MSKYTIYTDGASRGNPGDAGIGVVISTEDGTVVREIGEYIGYTTNNVAEYKALIRGLQECLDLGATAVVISTDSELLARQIAGVYKVKAANLKPLHAEAMSILRRFQSSRITHVMRELNTKADHLANEGLKKKMRHQVIGKRPKPEEPDVDMDRLRQGELEM